VEGTGFTMGGMVGSLCGVPLFTPANANSMSGMDAFLPGAVGLPDLLHEQGYFLSFLGGAPLDFAGKGKFLRTHHFDESAGFSELHGKTRDRAYINNWGLYDDTTFDFAYDRLVELARQKRPFGLFLLTLDTHPPIGYISRSAVSGPYGDGTNPMLNAVKASDELIAQFVERVRTSPAGKNTVIVIASDHLAMLNSASDRLRQGARSNLFLILDPRDPQGRRVDRAGSTLDIGATVLRPLGFEGRINLGRDLLDANTSESEIAHIQKTETLLSWRSELIRLWDFPRFKTTFSFEPKSARVKIDGREFQAPVLIELGDNGRTTLRFQFNALYETHLAEQAAKLPPGRKYLLVVKPDDARSLMADETTAQSAAPWILIAGKAGGSRMAVPLADEISYSRLQVDELVAGSPMVATRSSPAVHRVDERDGASE
jgi:phosphoglycerol transferase